MNADEYQKRAARTLIDAPDFQIAPQELGAVRAALLGFVYAAERVERVKKAVFHRDPAFNGVLHVGEPFDAPLTDAQVMLLWGAVGLAGEAGELVDHVRRHVFASDVLDADHMEKEAGDVTWYLAAICTKAGLRLGRVLQRNIEKLLARLPNGWSAADSRKRADER